MIKVKNVIKVHHNMHIDVIKVIDNVIKVHNYVTKVHTYVIKVHSVAITVFTDDSKTRRIYPNAYIVKLDITLPNLLLCNLAYSNLLVFTSAVWHLASPLCFACLYVFSIMFWELNLKLVN